MVKLIKGVNDLATINPELAAQWNYEKNAGLTNKYGHDISTPDKILAGSNQKVWWKMPYDVPMDYPVESLRGKHFDFEWEASIVDRSNGNQGCPYLAGQAVWKGFNDLATTNPDIAKEWNYEKNKNLIDGHGRDISMPDKITAKSNIKVWWKLPYDVPMDYPVKHLRGKHFDFEWETPTSHRSAHGTGCPYLVGQAVWKGFNDLATTNPELAAEWNYEKNRGLKDENGRDVSTPDKILAGTKQKVWWKKSYDVPMDYPVESLRGKHFEFEWDAAVYVRPDSPGCPFLSGQRVWKGFNDLMTTSPELAEAWNYEKNKGLTDGHGRDISTPDKVTDRANQKVWWKKSYDVPMDCPIESLRGKHFDFEWANIIHHQFHASKKGCTCPYLPPSCSKQESYMYMMLLDNGIPFVRESRYKKSENSGLFDIYLPENNMVIECDGKQHFEVVDYFHDRRSFDDCIKADNECNMFCKKKGITLLRLPAVIPFNKQWNMVQSVMNGGPIPESIIDFYSRYDFSNYSKIASAMNKGLVLTKTSKVKGVPMKSNDVIPDTVDEEYDEPDGGDKELE